jgi:hypothetical protein
MIRLWRFGQAGQIGLALRSCPRKLGKRSKSRTAQAPARQREAAAGLVIRRDSAMIVARKAGMSGF